MAIEVAKVELKTVQDASGLEACIRNGQFTADQVIAVIGKTEGNGGVNDFTRILADQAFRRVLLKHGQRSEQEVAQIPDGVVGRLRRRHYAACHGLCPQRKDRPCIEIPPRHRHRHERGIAAGGYRSAGHGQKVADGVKAAMRDAGIDDPDDVHYVQTKTPLLTIDSVRDAESRGQTCRMRGARFDGRVERHHGARHRRSAWRNRDAEG